MDDPTRRRRHAAGFTFIELMLAMLILGILTTIAVVAYLDYTKRTKMLEVMLAATACKTYVFEAYFYGAAPTPGNWGCERSGLTVGLVASVEVDPNGKISAIARDFNDADIDGASLTLMPIVDGVPAQITTDKGKGLKWRCGATADGTTIPTKYLPTSCRGN